MTQDRKDTWMLLIATLKKSQRPRIRLMFEPRDLWIGIYVGKPWGVDGGAIWYSIYICLIPMFPIQITWRKKYGKSSR